MKKLLLSLLTVTFFITTIYAQQDNNTRLNQLKKEKSDLTKQVGQLNAKIKKIDQEIAKLESQANSKDGGISGILTKVSDNGTKLRETPSSTGKEVEDLPAGTEILILKESQGLYLKANHKGKVGWVSYSGINTNAEIDAILMDSKKKQKPEDKAKYNRLAKIYGDDVAKKIMAGLLWNGMSQGMVIESIGRPTNTTKTNTPEGVRETWEYQGRKVYFLNGGLEKWDKN
ncbi:MAG: hypothetical protein C0594_01585 [Marinilabiliales bacterium]|nr:MAG: hypothetical protein C0594_01585 [Marinilabiliales bacterium]